MGNQTSVTVGALAGSLASLMWWIISETTTITAPEAIVAASVVLFSAALQYLLPIGGTKPKE
ncbi:MAG: hypothetical protein K6U74_00130 [Firmicutes bacterium]|nr:hypothetical protein [Bacillota bacterium]